MFKEWLLKDEKAKVGRPKLANDDILKKAKILIAIGIIISFVMAFIFFCEIKNISPTGYAYSLTVGKLGATINDSNSFIVEEKYDKNNNYVMMLKPSRKIKKYQGGYKYVLHKLKGSKWVKMDEKTFDKATKNISINIESSKNKNETYKVSVYIINAAKIDKSFAPFSWKFVDSSKQEEKYAYKVFTVKGYYSPVSLDEIKEANKKSNTKLTVATSKENPREFIINAPSTKYDIEISYTDENEKKVVLSKEKSIDGEFKIKVPNVNRLSNVVIKAWISNDIEKFKLTNWELKTDKNKTKYITNTYLLKPEASYRN